MWGKQCVNLPILSIIQSQVTHFHLSHEGQVSNSRDRCSRSQGVRGGVLLHQGCYVGQAMFKLAYFKQYTVRVTHFHLSHEGQVSNGRDRDSRSQGGAGRGSLTSRLLCGASNVLTCLF